MRKLMLFVLCLFPSGVKIFLYKKIFGWSIHKTATIGLSFIDSVDVVIGPNARIGSGNFIKCLDEFKMGDGAIVGNLNWISAHPKKDKFFFAGQNRSTSFSLGAHSAITNRHFIDCTDSFYVGNFSTFAGLRSQVLTHSINIYESRQVAVGVYIGDYCFIGSGCIILGGSAVPSFSILAAGSVLNKKFFDEFYLYAGVPAEKKKRISSEAKYFSRLEGVVN